MLTQEDIQNIVQKSFSEVTEEKLKDWFSSHLIIPQEIILDDSILKPEQKNFWLITDHTGFNDSNYRILHSLNEPFMFGLEMTTDSGRNGFLGFYGNLKETLENM